MYSKKDKPKKKPDKDVDKLDTDFIDSETVDDVQDNKTSESVYNQILDDMDKQYEKDMFVTNVLEDIREFVGFQVLPLADNLTSEHIELFMEKLNYC